MLGMMQYVQGQAKIINAVVRARTPLAHQRCDCNRRRTEFKAPQQQYCIRSTAPVHRRSSESASGELHLDSHFLERKQCACLM